MADQTVAHVAQQYKREWLERILADSPSSWLDVGCGDGELLQAAVRSGCTRCVGLEIDAGRVSACRGRGLEVHVGRAERLPFEDQSFEVVTLEYVAHHIEALNRALSEAARVTRRAVFILDPWYDTNIPSQQVAADFDGWSKAIDRRCGDVHNPCGSPVHWLSVFQAVGGFQIDYSFRLILRTVPISSLEETAHKQLTRVAHAGDLAADWSRLLDRARLHGVSAEGAASLRAIRA